MDHVGELRKQAETYRVIIQILITGILELTGGEDDPENLEMELPGSLFVNSSWNALQPGRIPLRVLPDILKDSVAQDMQRGASNGRGAR